MPYSLVLQYPYENIQIALCKDGLIIDSINLHKFDAVGKTIPSIQELLHSKELVLSDIAFFAANIGPAPYNTLRAILTTLNAIHTVTKIPLIGLNALDLLSSELQEKNFIIVLQAFENHVFYKLQNDHNISYAASSLEKLLNKINSQDNEIIIQGNGAIKYQQEFKDCKKIKLREFIMPFNKLETLAAVSYEQFIKNNFSSDYLKPIYFEDLCTNK